MMEDLFWLMDGDSVCSVDREEYYRIVDRAHGSQEEWDKVFKVARTEVGNLIVYTSFLGINHNFGNKEDPILFETMVQNKVTGDWLDYQRRCRTRKEAQEDHDRVVTFYLNNPNAYPEEVPE